jgi:hypothetical protein
MIPGSELEILANLYDRFANALDPESADRDKAEELFWKKLGALHCTHAPQSTYDDFRREAVRSCKMFLSKN